MSARPEPLQAATQVSHRIGAPAPGAGCRYAALVQSFGHSFARRDAFALQRRDRAGHGSRKGVCVRQPDRKTAQAGFLRQRLAAPPHDQPARRQGHQRRRLPGATVGTLTGSRCFAIARFWCLEPEPRQATPQQNDRNGGPAPTTGRRHRALVQCLRHCGCRRNPFALQRRDRAGHVARKGVCVRLNGRLTSQASRPI